jgi:RHS repeat-associated protein
LPAQSLPTQGLSTISYTLRYPGQVDDGNGLFYNFNRFYDPRVGRYTQADPIGLEGGWNRFGYVGGNPLGYADPEGLRVMRPQPGGNAHNRRQWNRHGPKPFDRPIGDGAQSAWESGAEMFTPDPGTGDYRIKCLRWECSQNSCTRGKLPTDFLPTAGFQDAPPPGCKCMQTTTGPIYNPPSFDPLLDSIDLYNKRKKRRR